MSQKKDFVPGKQADRRKNGKEFIKQLKVDGTSYNVTGEEVDLAEAAFEKFDGDIETGVEMDAAKQEQSKVTKKSDDDFETTWRNLAGRIKKSAGYDDGIGERYKIVGAEISIDPATSKPDLEESKVPEGWELSFNLHGYFDAVRIHRKRPSEEDFSPVAVVPSSPWVDTEPMINGTQYLAYYRMGNDEVGMPSDIVTIEV